MAHNGEGEGEMTREGAIAQRAMENALEFRPINISNDVDLDAATKIPLGKIAALGIAFSPLIQAFSPAAAGAGAVLLQATDHFGNAIDPSMLFKFKDYAGSLGSYIDAAGNLQQAELHRVVFQGTTMVDPLAILAAAAVMEISNKLDDIQATQKEMFNYLKTQDKASLRADLGTLYDILEDYQCNSLNQQFKSHKHIQVQEIRNRADKAIRQHRDLIFSEVTKGGLLRTDKNVRNKAQAVKNELEECRIAVYLYGFSSFLEVMLLENFDSGYMSLVTQRISDYAYNYRELYTHVYNSLEEDASSSLRAAVVGGLSVAAKKAGSVIAATPIGDKTQIDEALGSVGTKLGGLNDSIEEGMLRTIIEARNTDVLPFVASLASINRLYNKPSSLLVDKEAIYIMPNSEFELVA